MEAGRGCEVSSTFVRSLMPCIHRRKQPRPTSLGRLEGRDPLRERGKLDEVPDLQTRTHTHTTTQAGGADEVSSGRSESLPLPIGGSGARDKPEREGRR